MTSMTADAAESPPPTLAVSQAKRYETARDVTSGQSGQAASVSDNPVLWRELRRPLLRGRRQRATATITFLILLVISYLAFAGVDALDDNDLQIGFGFVFNGLLMLAVCVLSATAIAQEKEGDTWTLLLTTPMTGQAIIMGKFWGMVRKMAWPMLLIACHFALFAITRVISWTALAVAMWVMVTFNLVWIATGIFLSLRISKVTFAIVVNLMLPIVLYAVVPIVLVIIDEIWHFNSDLVEMTAYYLPYYYIGMSIDEIMPQMRGFDRRAIYLPEYSHEVTVYEWLRIVFYVGSGYLLATALVLWRTIARFDRIVGRAAQGTDRAPVALQAK